MAKQRRHYTAEEKVSILRRHLLEHVPVSKLCDGVVKLMAPSRRCSTRRLRFSPFSTDTLPSSSQ